jgi:hypothetical protein
VAARLLAVVGVRLGEEPAQADLLVGGEQVLSVTTAAAARTAAAAAAPGDHDAGTGAAAATTAAARRIRRLVGDADGDEALPGQGAGGVDVEERHVLGLHVGDVHGLAVGRHRDALRRDPTGELEAALGEDPRRRRRVLIDREHLDLVGVDLRDEQEAALHPDLLRARGLDDLRRRLVIAQVDGLAGRHQHRQIATGVDVAVHELVGRGVEHAERAADVVERGRLGRVGHQRLVAERLAVVADRDAVLHGRQAVAGLRTVHCVAGVVARHDAPAAGDLDVGGEPADRHGADQGIRIIGNIDDGDGMAECVRHVESIAIGADIQITRVRTVEVARAGRDRAERGERRAGVDAERVDLVLEPIGGVQPGARGVEHQVLGVEVGLELAEHRVARGVDHRREVRILVDDHHVRVGRDRGVDRRDPQPDRARAERLSGRPQVDPSADRPGRGVDHGDPEVGVAFAPGQRDVELGAVGSRRHGVGPAAKRLAAVRPVLAARAQRRVVGIDAVRRVGAAGVVLRAEHDLGEPRQPGARAGGLGSDEVLHRIAGLPGDDLAAGVGLDRRGEHAQVQRRLRPDRRQDVHREARRRRRRRCAR